MRQPHQMAGPSLHHHYSTGERNQQHIALLNSSIKGASVVDQRNKTIFKRLENSIHILCPDSIKKGISNAAVRLFARSKSYDSKD
jgi:hypothetical protein